MKSDWGCVTSGVPQGHINDLITGISSDVSKFPDDTKIGRVIESDQDAAVLQEELGRLHDWARK